MSPVSVDSLDIYNTFIVFPTESSFIQFPMVLPISCYAVLFGSHTNMSTISEKNLWFRLVSSTSFLCVSFSSLQFHFEAPYPTIPPPDPDGLGHRDDGSACHDTAHEPRSTRHPRLRVASPASRCPGWKKKCGMTCHQQHVHTYSERYF